MPYGDKSKEELLLGSHCIEFLLKKDVDLIIIACGTVSSNCYKDLIKKYEIPIINVIDPTIELLNKEKYHNIGVIGTHATINSKAFSNNLKQKQIIEIECPKLVPLIEANNINNKEFDKILANYLNVFNNIECLVLGCTHYPLLKDKINDYFNNFIKLIDMGESILSMIPDNSGKGHIQLYFTKLDNNLKENIKRILN